MLAKQCVGTLAMIKNGQILIGGLDVLVCFRIMLEVNNESVADAISNTFSNGGLVDDDEEEVGPTVLHRIADVSTGILEGRSGRLTVPEQHLCR